MALINKLSLSGSSRSASSVAAACSATPSANQSCASGAISTGFPGGVAWAARFVSTLVRIRSANV
ncbi:MAG TPA: hypothetical protein VN928_06990 [Myxococcales bacterium]|nr:hypothetical protein [Myxococcales bacterium]